MVKSIRQAAMSATCLRTKRKGTLLAGILVDMQVKVGIETLHPTPMDGFWQIELSALPNAVSLINIIEPDYKKFSP